MRKRDSIQFRVFTSLLLILVAGVSVSIVLTTTNQKVNLLDAAQRTLRVNTEMLNTTIRNIMLAGEAPIANRTMEGFRGITGFLEFEVYRTDGSSAFNDFQTLDFVNSYQDRVMFEQTPRRDERIHESPGFDRVLMNKTPVIELNEDQREMEYFFPILNYADCRGCHGTDQFIRGISHFRISLAGIYDQVNRAGLRLTLFFVAVGALLFTWILLVMRRSIILPVLTIGDAVNIAATGNLDIRVDLDRPDEVGELAGRVNAMISGLRERRELELQNKVFETRLVENRKYLDHIKEGLLLLNTERRITGQYSVYLSRLFRRDDIAGLSLADFLFPDPAADRERREELEGFLDILFTNTTADMDMIMSINPLSEAGIRLADGQLIIIRADFLRIRNGGILENVMVIFEDLTDIVRTRGELEDQRRRRESELEQIATMLRTGPQVFEGFLDEAHTTIGALKSDHRGPGVLDSLFRTVHSLKGTARYLDLRSVEEIAHRIEDRLAELRSNASGAEQAGPISGELVSAFEDELSAVRRLVDRFREFAVGSGRPERTALELFGDRLTDMVRELARELDKEVEFHLDTELTDVPVLADIQSAIFHLIRNALDHGIEDVYERLSSGKRRISKLVLRLGTFEDQLVIEVEDDGRGLDLEALERRGVETGLLKPGIHLPSQIVNMLFRPGFSSRDGVSSISGRGVGLDAVKEDVRSLKGRINVRTARGRGTTFILTIPVGPSTSRG